MYVSNKFVILPSTVESKWSLVEVNVIMVCPLDAHTCAACSGTGYSYSTARLLHQSLVRIGSSFSLLCIGCSRKNLDATDGVLIVATDPVTFTHTSQAPLLDESTCEETQSIIMSSIVRETVCEWLLTLGHS